MKKLKVDIYLVVFLTLCFSSISYANQAWIAISTTPPNATVYLDGKVIGQTPIKSLAVAPGEYRIKVILDEYQSIEEVVTVRNNRVEKFEYRLIKASYNVVRPKEDAFSQLVGTLSLITDPPEAEVFINDIQVFEGEKKALTPFTLENVGAGKLTIKFKKKLDKINRTVEVVKKVTLEANKTLAIMVDFSEHFGALTVITKPPAAKVYLNNNKYLGTTPNTFDYIEEGEYTLLVSSNIGGNWKSNKDFTSKIRIERLKTHLVEVDFMKLINTAEINLDVKPFGVEYKLARKDRTLFTGIASNVELCGMMPSRYQIELFSEGYKSESHSFLLNPDEIISITGGLKYIVPEYDGFEDFNQFLSKNYKPLEEYKVHLSKWFYAIYPTVTIATVASIVGFASTADQLGGEDDAPVPILLGVASFAGITCLIGSIVLDDYWENVKPYFTTKTFIKENQVKNRKMKEEISLQYEDERANDYQNYLDMYKKELDENSKRDIKIKKTKK